LSCMRQGTGQLPQALAILLPPKGGLVLSMQLAHRK